MQAVVQEVSIPISYFGAVSYITQLRRGNVVSVLIEKFRARVKTVKTIHMDSLMVDGPFVINCLIAW